jgi:hypothetical protein
MSYLGMIHDREELNALKAKRLGDEPADEAAHFYICKACGQAVNKRKLGDVFYHEEPGHRPIPLHT